jgi:hypothetical protein
MIQRIQSVYLAGVIVLSLFLFFMPFSEKAYNDPVKGSLLLNQLIITQNPVFETAPPVRTDFTLMFINLAVIAISLFTIFKFKNRKLQMTLCMLTGLCSAIMLVLVFYFSGLMFPAASQPHYLTAIYIVVVQLILLVAARAAINKDEKLVRAADRIR